MKEFYSAFNVYSLFLVISVFVIFSNAADTIESEAGARALFAKPKKSFGPEKEYTGIRLRNNTMLIIYYYDQTIAVVELTSALEMVSCELLEARRDEDQRVALNNLRNTIPMTIQINFGEMKVLMAKCQVLDSPPNLSEKFINKVKPKDRIISAGEFTSLFSGVFPGTKWCGNGDIAGSYYDLGQEKDLDKCCRTHDLCPVKIPAYKTKYNITNLQFYTRSHCDCDEIFYKCLQSKESPSMRVVGNIYFNVGKLTCIEENKFSGERKIVTRNMRF